MESLMSVMAAKKRELSTIQAEKQSTNGMKKKKYMRRGEVEELLYAQEKKQQETQQQNDAMAAAASKKRKLEKNDNGDETHKKQSDGKNLRGGGAAGSTAAAADDEEETAVLSWAEMRRRLRDLGEPITLFGESKRERMERLRHAENDAALRREDQLGDGHATHNEFVGHERSSDSRGFRADAVDDDDDDDDDDDGELGNGGRRAGKRTSERDGANGSGGDAMGDEDEKDDIKVIYHFFRTMLRRWEQDLADRPDHIRRTAQGKTATKTMKQCKDYIRPLFKLCKKREVPLDILPSLAEIVRFCKDGEFVQANDAYIKLAIGNAAWPIGVTMVGIHERTGREKINANKQAHVMNNEAQRKYITSVKRVISYAQSVSNVLPSKKVN